MTSVLVPATTTIQHPQWCDISTCDTEKDFDGTWYVTHRKTLLDADSRLVQVFVATHLTAELELIGAIDAGVIDGGHFLTADEAQRFGAALVQAAAFLADGVR